MGTELFTCLSGGHVILAEMHSVHAKFVGEPDVVVNYHYCVVLFAEGYYFECCGTHLVVRCVFHA